MTSRTTTSAARSAPAADAMSDSTARHAPSRPTLYPRLSAARRAALWRRPPRNPCSNKRGGTLQGVPPTSGGKSFRCGLRQPMRPPVASGDRARSKSSVYVLSSAQMTRVRLTPAPGLRPPRASRRVPVTRLPFFYPSSHRVARDAEGARQSAQGTAFVVSAQDLFALWFCVGIAARLFSTALRALAAQVTLAAIRSHAVTHQSLALAMLTSKSNSNHCRTLACHLDMSHYPNGF